MVSVLFASTIMCVLFWGVFFIKKTREIPVYSKPELAVFYGMTRLMPVFMLTEITGQVIRNAVWDLIILVILGVYISKNKPKNRRSCVYALYLFQPAAILSITCGTDLYMAFILLGIVAAGAFDIFYVQKKGGSLLAFLPEYTTLNIGAAVLFAAVKLKSENGISAMHIVSFAIFAAAVTLFILRLAKGRIKLNFRNSDNEKTENCGCLNKKGNPLTWKDFLAMGLLTAAFSVMIFVGLGSNSAPQTSYILNQDSNQIVFDFGRETKLTTMYVHLTCESDAEFIFAVPDADGSQWTALGDKKLIESPFRWNVVPIDTTVTKLALILNSPRAYITEIVCFNSDGNVVQPVNASDYSTIFDEQTTFPPNDSYYYRTFFDEVYHARTAYEFIHGLPIYEATHPPLGKSIISLGIRMFGMTPFGWRFMCAVCGILIVPLMYLFAHKMFGNTLSASFTTLLTVTEFMHLALSSIATLDIIIALFILLMFYFMYGFAKCLNLNGSLKIQLVWLLLCGISTGLAIATKWTGFYAVLGIAVIFFASLIQKNDGINKLVKKKDYLLKLGLSCCAFFIVIPLTIYVLSYIPFQQTFKGYGLAEIAYENSKFMLSYHADTVFDHMYSSEWYEWLIDRVPLTSAHTTVSDGQASIIVTMGNPVILWLGLAAFAHQIYLWRCKKCANAQFLVIAYLAMLLPWLFIHRTVFIYQYFADILIFAPMICNSVNHIRHSKKTMAVISALSAGAFAMFYPILSGINVSADYVNTFLEWLPTWTFSA